MARGTWRAKSQVREITRRRISHRKEHVQDIDIHTQILHILIGEQGNEARGLALSHTRPVALVDDDSVSQGGGDEGQTIREACPAGVPVEGHVRQAVAEGAEQQRDVPDKPSKLECLRELYDPLL
jgi:hypothetical protein